MATPAGLLVAFALVLLLASPPCSASESLLGGQGERASKSCPPCSGVPYSGKILIAGGTVVNADLMQVADVYIEDEKIVAVSPNIVVGDDVKVIDATGKYVMPGGIEPHTHLDMDFMGTRSIDDFFIGQSAGLAGGTTMHMDFVVPLDGSLLAGFEYYMKKSQNSVMDYGFHLIIKEWNANVSDEVEIIVKEKGINAFKFFMSYKGTYMVRDDLLMEGFAKCKSVGAIAMVHAENGDAVADGESKMLSMGIIGPEGSPLARPPLLEGEATARAIRLARYVNTPLYVVHVTSNDAMQEIAKARVEGQRVIGEAVCHALLLNDSALWDPDFKIASMNVLSPPLRKASDNVATQAALSNGILQLVATDHIGFNSTQKALGINDFTKIPNGGNGIQERMSLVWDTMVESGQISATDYVKITSTNCAKIFNIYPQKGVIRAGSDADVIVLNPNGTFEISVQTQISRSDLNIYDGRTGKGTVDITISRGRVVWENNQLTVNAGSGRYIHMPPFGHLFNGLEERDAARHASMNAPVQRDLSLYQSI